MVQFVNVKVRVIPMENFPTYFPYLNVGGLSQRLCVARNTQQHEHVCIKDTGSDIMNL